MLDLLKLHPDAFGLDISDLSLKIARLKKKGKNFSLSSFGIFPIKPGIIEKGEIKKQDELADIIKKSVLNVKGEPLKTKYVVASLPEEESFLEVIRMPLMEKEELAKAVKYEAENYIPLPVEQVYLDFQIVKPVYDNKNYLEVLLAALPQKIVDPYIEVLNKAGLKLLALEIESQPTVRAVVKNELSPVPLLIIDLGATRTSFIIFSGYSLRFTCSIPVCSRTFTNAIAKNLNVSFDKAEKIKEHYGFSEKRKVFEILTPALTDLIEQIQKYLKYYQTHGSYEHLPPNGHMINKIILCGGGANMKGLGQMLSQELKTSTEIANPWVNILPEPSKVREIPPISLKESLKYTTVLGLALRAVNL